MREPIKDGGPAFPRPASEGHHVQNGEDYKGYGEQAGMTLRDYFAGQALAGMLSAPMGEIGARARENATVAAQWAYDHADAMIAAREAKQ